MEPQLAAVPTFQPKTLTTGVAPSRAAAPYVAAIVCDSPGQSVMSLSE